ncbi:MAG: hypothetical protein HY862_18465 [Chloroflexi bacterium]|nr:hypothetical protein [Chloroflexota bacterium]
MGFFLRGSNKLILLALVLILLGLNACGAEHSPVIVTEIPTNTPSQSAPPTATFTPIPTVAVVAFNTLTLIPTVERRRDLTSTLGPSPTSPLRPTFTPAPATLTVTALPTLAGLEIEYFANETTGALAPGANVTLFWRVSGAERVSIYRLDAEGERTKEWRVDNEGRITVATEITDVDEAKFELVASNADGVANAEVTVPLAAAANCALLWFFSPPPATCPNGAGDPTFQVEQRFEHGSMIWLGNTKQIIIIYSDDQQPRWLIAPDLFTDGQPERDETIQPPPNLFQPIRGFGLVWRDNPRTRDRLGWATEPEVGYDGIVQVSGLTDNDKVTYLRTRDGGILELSENGGAWQILPYQPPVAVPPTSPPATASQ